MKSLLKTLLAAAISAAAGFSASAQMSFQAGVTMPYQRELQNLLPYMTDTGSVHTSDSTMTSISSRGSASHRDCSTTSLPRNPPDMKTDSMLKRPRETI